MRRGDRLLGNEARGNHRCGCAGGSVRDDANTARADELSLAMILTGERQFLH